MTREISPNFQHGSFPRGLEEAGKSPDRQLSGAPNFGSRFGRFFPGLKGAHFNEEDLTALATAMVAEFDPPKDGPDGEESGIPALYTYFGQFVDHDLTFDPQSSFQKSKDKKAIVDFRTAAFDLDNVYGRGPGDQPYMYDADNESFLLGDEITNGKPNPNPNLKGARDLPRSSSSIALIGDKRNDENAIVSQLQGLFLRFHNRLIKDENMSFDDAQRTLRDHYQFVAVNDFLPKIVQNEVLDDLKTGGKYNKAKLKLYSQDDLKNPFMPLEFSVAAYRLGHSMVRPGYRLNDAVLAPIFPVIDPNGPNFPEGLTGFRKLISNWAIDWGRFINLDERDYGKKPEDVAKEELKEQGKWIKRNFERLQFAYKIDASLVDPLGSLPPPVVGIPSAANPASLALRNLKRGVRFGLPSGQDVAKALTALGVATPILSDEKIHINKADGEDKVVTIDSIAKGAFRNKCPLWTYILAEAADRAVQITIPVKGEKRKISTPQLGPVGGRIVAEVFIGLLFADVNSFLHDKKEWKPNAGNDFGLRELVSFAVGNNDVAITKRS